MGDKFAEQSEALRSAASDHSEVHGTDLVAATSEASALVLVWIGYLQGATPPGPTGRILNAVQASIIEIAGCLSLGLVRPALFSIRTELELMLAWMFFKDHPVEWKYAEETGRNFPPRAATLKYLKDYGPKFEKRLKILAKDRRRSSEDPYALLSIHVHSQTVSAMPDVGDLNTLVKEKTICEECVELQRDVAEYLSDILAAWNADSWADLPEVVRENITARLSNPKLKDFCQ